MFKDGDDFREGARQLYDVLLNYLLLCLRKPRPSPGMKDLGAMVSLAPPC